MYSDFGCVLYYTSKDTVTSMTVFNPTLGVCEVYGESRYSRYGPCSVGQYLGNVFYLGIEYQLTPQAQVQSCNRGTLFSIIHSSNLIRDMPHLANLWYATVGAFDGVSQEGSP